MQEAHSKGWGQRLLPAALVGILPRCFQRSKVSQDAGFGELV